MVARAWDGEAAERPVRLQIGRALAGVLTFSGDCQAGSRGQVSTTARFISRNARKSPAFWGDRSSLGDVAFTDSHSESRRDSSRSSKGISHTNNARRMRCHSCSDRPPISASERLRPCDAPLGNWSGFGANSQDVALEEASNRCIPTGCHTSSNAISSQSSAGQHFRRR